MLMALYVLAVVIGRVGSGGDALRLNDFSLLIPLIAGLVCLGLGLSSKMMVTPNALIVYQFGLRVQSSLLSLGLPLRGSRTMTVLHLGEPVVIDWVWLAAGYKAHVTAMPLAGYPRAAGSPLRADLERFARQIFG